jgi:hypothetical protein
MLSIVILSVVILSSRFTSVAMLSFVNAEYSYSESSLCSVLLIYSGCRYGECPGWPGFEVRTFCLLL